MVAPTSTYTEAKNNIRRAVQALNEIDKLLNSNAANILGIYQTILEALNGDFSSDMLASFKALRSSLTGSVTEGQVVALLTPYLKDMMLAIGKQDEGFIKNSIKLRDHLVANSFSMNSSGMTYATPAAGGGNQGTGTINRLTVDEDDTPLEAKHLELVTITCKKDVDQGQRYKEEFLYEGVTKIQDKSIVSGSGIRKTLISRNGDDSSVFLNNPHFILTGSTQPAAAAPVVPATTTSIRSWVLSSTAAFRVSVDQVYRGAPKLTTNQSLEMVANGSFSQTLQDEKKPSLSLVRPVFVQFPVYRDSSATTADGQLKTTWGTDIKTIADITTGLTNNAWNLVTHPIDKNRFFKNYKTTGANKLMLEAEWSGRTGGALYFAAPIVTYYDLVDGTWIVLVGGQTDWRESDVFTYTDSQTSRGSQKYWLEFRSGLQKSLEKEFNGFAYPSNNAGVETWLDL